MEEKIRGMFGAVDSQDSTAFLRFLTPDASFTFANWPAARGPDAIRAVFDGFCASIKDLRHEFVGIWNVDDVWFAEQRVHYVDQWDRQHDLPCTNVLRVRDGLVSDYRIYMDNTPLFQPPVAAAA